MLRGVKVGAGVAIWRRIAATNVAALKTHAQVHPRAPGFQAFFAALGVRRHFLKVVCDVRTF